MGEDKKVLYALQGLTQRFDAELEAQRIWRQDIGYAIFELQQDVGRVVSVLGEPPDPTTGAPGSGMRGQWVAAINAVIKGEARRLHPALDDDEDEVTGVLDREALVIAKRKAEFDRDRERKRLRTAVIGLVTTAITTLGAVVVAIAT